MRRGSGVSRTLRGFHLKFNQANEKSNIEKKKKNETKRKAHQTERSSIEWNPLLLEGDSDIAILSVQLDCYKEYSSRRSKA